MTASYFGAIVGHENKKAEDRNLHDYYPTPPIATFTLCSMIHIPDVVWEPAAGRGHISRELIRCKKTVHSSDLFSYENPLVDIKTGVDFLSAPMPMGVRAIVTNPPYKDRMAEMFVLKALKHEVSLVAVLCRMQFLNSKSRYESLFSKTPPSDVLIFPQRVNCSDQTCESPDAKDQLGGMLEYAWFVWDRRGIPSGTRVHWADMKRMVNDWNSRTSTSISDFF